MGKSDITSKQELRTYVLKEIKNAVQKATEKIKDELWENISGIYSNPKSEFYDRTDEFLKSIIIPKEK